MTAAGSALSNGYHPGCDNQGEQPNMMHTPPNVAGVYYDAGDMSTNMNPYLQVSRRNIIAEWSVGVHMLQVLFYLFLEL